MACACPERGQSNITEATHELDFLITSLIGRRRREKRLEQKVRLQILIEQLKNKQNGAIDLDLFI